MELWVFLGLVLFVWLISPIILLIALLVTRNKLKQFRIEEATQPVADQKPTPIPAMHIAAGNHYSAVDLENFILLHLELRRQAQAETLTAAQYAALTEQLDTLWSRYLAGIQLSPDSANWRERRRAAWNHFADLTDQPPGPPPWQPVPKQEPKQEPKPETQQPAVSITPIALTKPPVEIPPPPVVPEPPVIAQPAARFAAKQPESESEPLEADWSPAEPSAFERLLGRVSGWPQLAVPFLVQNIGWFIGGFCLIAGTVFLVRNTSGFMFALVVFASLLGYSGFLLWAGYQLRSKRPELSTASGVLLSISMLLVPLNVAVAARLIAAAEGPLLIVGVGLTGLVLGVLYWAVTLASTLMDRSLQGLHPRLVVALAAVQLAVPALPSVPHWAWLAALHSVVLVLMGYGLFAFTHHWVRNWFIDQRRTAYYAGGLLVYSAAVSFIHLTWAYPGKLPDGYFGPFLMILSGLLFQVDAAFKEWVNKYPALSRFTFGLYGLSALAVAVGIPGTVPAIITLGLGTGLYGWVTWRYLTWPPLYLMLACLSGAYGLLVLKPLAYEWYFLASLPGLIGLLGVIRWAQPRSRKLAQQCFGVFSVLLAGLTGWSLYWAEPGLPGMATALIASAGLYVLTRQTLLPLALSHRTETAVWYLVTLLATVAVLYSPSTVLLKHEWQWAFGCAGLAMLWTWRGLGGLRRFPQRAPVFLLSALLNTLLALGIGLANSGLSSHDLPALVLLLGILGGVLLWQSLQLRQQILFYGLLLCWGGAGALFKAAYLPSSGVGLSQFLLVLPFWALLWWLQHRFPLEHLSEVEDEGDEDEDNSTPMDWITRFFTPQPLHPVSVVRQPLAQVLILLWLIGFGQLTVYLFNHGLTPAWPWSAAAGALATVLVLGYFHQLIWIAPLPLLLGLGAILGFLVGIPASPALLSVTAAFYALLSWWLGIRLLDHPLTLRWARALYFVADGGGARQVVEQSAMQCTSIIAGFAVPFSLLVGIDQGPNVAPLLALAISGLFFGITAWHYRLSVQSYAVLATLTAAVWLLDFWRDNSIWVGLGQAPANALLGLVLAGIALTLEKRAATLSDRIDLYRRPLQVTAVALALLAASYVLSTAGLKIGFQPVAWADSLALLLAGGALLLATFGRQHWNVLGVFLVTWAVYALMSSWLYMPWPAYSGLVLAVLACTEAALANYLDGRDDWDERWAAICQALYGVAGLAYGVALLAAVVSFLQGDSRLPGLLAVLSLGLLPLLKPLETAPFWRSVGLASLLTALLYSLATLRVGPVSPYGLLIAISWGYVLWLVGNVLVARFNARWPIWALAEAPWPWLGLLVVLFGTLTGLTLPSAAFFMLGLSLYLLLLIRNSAWAVFPWLAVATGAVAGLMVGEPWSALMAGAAEALFAMAWQLTTLLWLNLMLLAVPFWRRYGPAIAARLEWQRNDLEIPLAWLPFALLLIPLAQLLMLEGVWAYGNFRAASFPIPLWGTAVLIGSLGHALWVQPSWAQAQAFMLGLYAFLIAGTLILLGSATLLPPVSALWSGALLLIWRYRLTEQETFTRVLNNWLFIMPLLTGVLLLTLPGVGWGERAVTLGILAVVTAAQGWWWEQRCWLTGSLALVLACGYALWPALLPLTDWWLLMPWYAVQTMLIVWGLTLLRGKFERWLTQQATHSVLQQRVEQLQQVFSEAIAALLILPLLMLAAHTLQIYGHLVLHSTASLPWLIGPSLDAGAAIVSWVLLLAMTVRLAWQQSDRAEWVYAGALLGLALMGYVRLITLGVTPFTVLESGVLIAVGYGVFMLQRFTGSVPLYRVALVIPLLALFILPPLQTIWQGDGSTLFAMGADERVSISGLLLAVAVLYIALSNALHRPLPIYLGVLALNAGIYLWVPHWAKDAGLWQFYVIPAAVTVLALLHWHRQELRPAVLNGARLATMSVLYASVLADVFQAHTGLMVFVLALVLNLLGIALGIALRIRAFLYAGVAFLVLNVTGQLLRYYPEQGLSRALILIGLGVAITVGMVGFNIKREAIMQRLRIVRADLADWE